MYTLDSGVADIPQQPFFNAHNANCSLCSSLTQTYISSERHDSVHFDNSLIRGEYSRTLLENIELSVVDMTILKEMTLSRGSAQRKHCMGITCCFEGGMTWVSANGQKTELAKGDLLIEEQSDRRFCNLFKGQQFRCVELAVNTDDQLLGNDLFPLVNSYFKQATMSPRVRGVISDIFNGCPNDSVRGIYCQGKAYELFALVLDAIYEAKEAIFKSHLSRDRTEQLLLAKKIIDMDITNAPSLTQLSRQIYLNKCTLNSEFKKFFGLPIHSYIIQQRLETALQLLQRGNITVTEVALRVGYTELGRFAATFKKKYGISPSQVLKRII